MSTQYVTKAELKTYLGLSGTAQDTNLDNAINGASRQIDKICDRRFWQDSTVQIKKYTPTNNFWLIVDDISTTTGLIVKLDTTDDGTFDTTLTLNTDYILEPVNPKEHVISSTTYYYPHNMIKILSTRSSERFDTLIQNNVQITAKFGWSAVPEAIKQATLIQATRLFKRKDAPFNVMGNEQTGVIELFSKFDADAKELIKPYKLHAL